MNEKRIARILTNTANVAAPAEQIDIWPALHTRLQTTPPSGTGRGEPFTRGSHPFLMRPVILLLTALLLTLGIVLATPRGQAWAEGLYMYFFRAESNIRLPSATIEPAALVAVTPGLGAATPTRDAQDHLPFEEECGPLAAPRCTPEQIQDRLPFQIYLLTDLPDDLKLIGITGGPERISILYNTGPFSGSLVLSESALNAELPVFQVGADASIQQVSIQGIPGELVKGTWTQAATGELWTGQEEMTQLLWETDEQMFELIAIGGRFQSDDLVTYAESLLPSQSVDAPPGAPPPNPARLVDETGIETLAGFDVRTPQQFFTDYKLTQYTYSAVDDSVCLHYLYAPLEFEFHPVVYLVQSPTLDPQFGAGANLETVTIPGADQGEGWVSDLYSNGDKTLPVCDGAAFFGGDLVSWQIRGITYQLYSSTNPMDGGYISRSELVEMAGILTNATPGEELTELLNPPSIPDLEEQTGFPILAPSRLPEGTVFSHSLYDEVTQILSLVYTGLSIHQSDQAPDPLEMCFNPAPPPAEAIQSVDIQATPAQYAQGGWTLDPVTSQPAVWDSRISSENLAWQTGGIGYCIQASLPIDTAQETLIQIAESLQ